MVNKINQKLTLKVLELVSSNCYQAQIAKHLEVNSSTILRKLKQMELLELIKAIPHIYPKQYTLTKTGSTMLLSMSNSITDKGNSSMYGQTINANRIHSTHKIKFSIRYEGEQPKDGKIKPFGRYKKQIQVIYRPNRYVTIIAFKKKLNVWIKDPVGNRTEEQLQYAKREAFDNIIKFAKKYNLILLDDLVKILLSHHVVESKAINTKFKPLFDKYGKEIEEHIGSKYGDSSHPDQIEHEGKGRPDRVVQGSDVAKGLEWLTVDFPIHFAMVAQQQDRYDENIRKHLAVMEEMSQTLKAIRDSLKK